MNQSAIRRGLVVVALVGGVTLLGWAAEHDEVEVALGNLPAAVQKAVAAEEGRGTGKAVDAARLSHGGKPIYEVEFVRDGQEFDVVFAEDGTVLERDALGEPADDVVAAPPAVMAALRELTQGARLIELEREREHGVVVYEAEWRVGGVVHEAVVTTDGTLVELEERVRLAAAPEAVRQAVAKHFPDSRRVTIEKKQVVVYEITAHTDGREREILVHPTGRIVRDIDDELD